MLTLESRIIAPTPRLLIFGKLFYPVRACVRGWWRGCKGTVYMCAYVGAYWWLLIVLTIFAISKCVLRGQGAGAERGCGWCSVWVVNVHIAVCRVPVNLEIWRIGILKVVCVCGEWGLWQLASVFVFWGGMVREDSMWLFIIFNSFLRFPSSWSYVYG